MTIRRFPISLADLTYHAHQQPRRRQADPRARNAAQSRNPARRVVVVLVVLGSEIVEVVATQNFDTRGPKVSWPAKHGRNGKQVGPDKKIVLNN